MQYRLAVALPLISLPLWTRPAQACSVCGCGDPLVDASESVPNMSSLRLALNFEVLSADAASDDDPGSREFLTQVTFRPVIVWSPIEELNLVAQIPITRKDWKLEGDENAAAKNTGLGDIDLGARYFFWHPVDVVNQTRQDLGITAGVSLATGGNDAKDGDGQRIDDHAQLGTGSYGPYVGLMYAFHRDPWNLFVSGTAQFHTTNDFGYHYGTSARWSVRGDYRIVNRVSVQLGLDGRYAAHDDIEGEEQVNTGGLLLAATPGVSVNIAGDLWVNGRVQIPFATDLYGDQSFGPTVFASVQMLVR